MSAIAITRDPVSEKSFELFLTVWELIQEPSPFRGLWLPWIGEVHPAEFSGPVRGSGAPPQNG